MNVERKADNRPDVEPARGSERRTGLEPERGNAAALGLAGRAHFVGRGGCQEIERGSLEERCASYGGPAVRILLPPAASQERTPPSRDRNGSGRCAQSGAPRPVPLQHRARQAQMANRLYSSVDEKRGSGHLGLIDRAEQGAPYRRVVERRAAMVEGHDVHIDEEKAGVSLMITQEQKAALRERGHDDDQIREMKPADAHSVLGIIN
jgi:hypothetical protein